MARAFGVLREMNGMINPLYRVSVAYQTLTGSLRSSATEF
jgi:hypothetical protein